MSGISFNEIYGINFSIVNEISAFDLSKLLCKITNFLQTISPDGKLEQYDDWLEHDGLNFHKKSIDFNELFSIIQTPQNIYDAMPEDFNVFIGIAPQNKIWYLRFYLDIDERIENSVGRMDITLDENSAKFFEAEIINETNFSFNRRNAQEFYNSIMR